MPQYIKDYHEKTDRQLLEELVIQGNSVVAHLKEQNGKVNHNCTRITRIEAFLTLVPVVLGIITKMNNTWPWS
ncbi:MAG: hypothetical protein WC291_03685 [Thermodesulfovibrionales bacterium]|jgi:hypothetical protein